MPVRSAPSAASVLDSERPGFAELYREETELGRGPIGRRVLCGTRDGQVAVKLVDLELAHDTHWSEPFFEAVAKQQELANRCHFVQPVQRSHRAFGAVAYPHVGGLTLAACIRQYRKLDARYAIELFARLAEALQAAHDLDLLHRHLYLGNVLLAQPNGGVMTPQLMDLGHLQNLPAARLERLGESLCCLAPELAGDLRNATPRSDIYALGVCLYQTVTGLPPLQAASLAALQTALTHADALPDPRATVPELPEGLCQVIGWCVALAPEQRYQRVADVHRDLLAVRRQLAGH